MRALTQYLVYDGDTGEEIKTYEKRSDAYDRVDFEFAQGRVWAAVRPVTVTHFENTIYVNKERISC